MQCTIAKDQDLSKKHEATESLSDLNCLQKNKEKIQKKTKKTGDLRYIDQNEQDKAYFQHNMAYRDSKDLPRRTVSDNVLHDKALNVAKISKT